MHGSYLIIIIINKFNKYFDNRNIIVVQKHETYPFG